MSKAKAVNDVSQVELDKILAANKELRGENTKLHKQVDELKKEVQQWGRIATERRLENEFLEDKLREVSKPAEKYIIAQLTKENTRLAKAIDACFFYLQLGEDAGDKAVQVVACAKEAYMRGCDDEDARFREKDED